MDPYGHYSTSTTPAVDPIDLLQEESLLSLFLEKVWPNLPQRRQRLNEEGLAGILKSGELRPSLESINPNVVRYGIGQCLADIIPGTKTLAQLSREFIGQPFQGKKYTRFLEFDTTGLLVIEGRPGVFVNPGEVPLDLTGRIINSGVH